MKNKVLNTVLDYVQIIIGCAINSLGWTSFMLPNGVIDGGLTGLSAILEMVTGIPLDIFFFSMNAALIIIGTLVLGRGFGIRTIFAIIVCTVMLRLFSGEAFNFLKCMPGQPLYVSEKILVPVIGGLMEAVGIGLIFLRGGSTGGSDILAMLVNKFWPISPGRFYLVSDLVVISSIVLIPGHTFADMIYGYIAMFTFSFAIDFVLLGNRSTVQVLIFSDRYGEIADFINKKLERGVTALRAVGWYTQKDRNVLLVLVLKSQLQVIFRAVKDIDPKAFISVSPASNVYGEGFEEIKAGLQRKKKE